MLNAAGRAHGFELAPTEYGWGCDHYVETGAMMPEDALDRLASADAIFLGAVGRHDVPDHVSLWGLLIPIRRRFRQYVNERPMRLWPGVPSPLRDVTPEDLDLVVVRENNEGEYSEIGGRLHDGHRDGDGGAGDRVHAHGLRPRHGLRLPAGGRALGPHLLGHEVERDHPHDALLGRALRGRAGAPPGAGLRAGADRRAGGAWWCWTRAAST